MARLFDEDPQTGGYDYQFVSPDDPPGYLICLICFSVAMSPQQMDCCGKLYCEECLTEHKKHSNKCPHCRKAGRSFNDRRGELFKASVETQIISIQDSLLIAARDILALKVKCKNNEHGCQWTGELRFLEEHSCDYTSVQCPNRCQASVISRNLSEHLEQQCPKRQYSCPDCGERGPHDKITTEHLQQCPNAMVQCPNEGCSFADQRCNFKQHKCLYEQVPCKYSDIGCRERQIRRNMEAHEQDSVHHLNLTIEKVIQLQQEVTVLREENEVLSNDTISNLKERVQQANSKIEELRQEKAEMKREMASFRNISTNQRKVTFRLFPYLTYKETETDFNSIPYYSSDYGYRFSIQVSAIGKDSGRGTHVSVYAYLLMGAHDNSLTWPFPGLFVIELLNQLEDKNHLIQYIAFPEEHQVSKRVMDEQQPPSGYGYHQYIAHADLEYKSEPNTQYLKNDMLIFRVSVQVPNFKHWLEMHI